ADSLHLGNAAIAELEALHGVTLQHLGAQEAWGMTPKEIVDEFLRQQPELGRYTLQQEVDDSLMRHYQPCQLRERQALARLAAAGIMLGIITSNTRKAVLPAVKASGITIPFIRGYEDRPPGTGKGFSLLEALGLYGLLPEQMAFVGDHPKDIAAARDAGVMAIAIATGHHSKAELSLCKPDCIVESIAALESVVFGRK
ncbi:hypothetical protein COY28_05725, partial [Candidatus Woesearchaeota archaeon CG_4_10_14_0_2_um_filter_57_5]